MPRRDFRVLMVIALVVGTLPSPVLAACDTVNISLTNVWSGATWNAMLNGYQLSGGCDYSFDCSPGQFLGCTLCLLTAALTDPNHDGSYSGIGTNGSQGIGPKGCGSVNNTGTINFGPWPSMVAGLPSNDPYKIRFYASALIPGGCTNNPGDYDYLMTASGTTPPF
jgi:hypothetical protein